MFSPDDVVNLTSRPCGSELESDSERLGPPDVTETVA